MSRDAGDEKSRRGGPRGGATSAGRQSRAAREPSSGRGRPRSTGGPSGSASARPDTRRPGTGAARLVVPPIDDDVTGAELAAEVKQELATLRSASAGTVARHLVMAGRLLDTDPEAAWLHAAEARRLAGRVAIVREAAGVAAYSAAHYGEARTELRAARRLNGSPGYLPLLADCERGLGRPERALELLADPDVERLEPADALELHIVAAGALRDLGRLDEAVGLLEARALASGGPGPGAARLDYAYADLLAAAGRTEDALRWFTRAAERDDEDETDAAERVAALEGVRFDDSAQPTADQGQ